MELSRQPSPASFLGSYDSPPRPCVELSDRDKSPQRFNFEDADITFRSSDGVLYAVHRNNLNCCAGGFPPSAVDSSKDDVVQMTETSKVLNLLFAFMYPNPTPEVEHLPFGVLADLAEAAEKFQVFSAMTICKMHMTAAASEHPIEVLRYAAIHRYPELLDMVATVAIGHPLAFVVLQLPSRAVIAWVQYHQRWQDALADLYSTNERSCSCSGFISYRSDIFQKFGGKVESMCLLETIFTTPNERLSGCCTKSIDNWRQRAYNNRTALPKFSTFLFPKSVVGIWEYAVKHGGKK